MKFAYYCALDTAEYEHEVDVAEAEFECMKMDLAAARLNGVVVTHMTEYQDGEGIVQPIWH